MSCMTRSTRMEGRAVLVFWWVCVFFAVLSLLAAPFMDSDVFRACNQRDNTQPTQIFQACLYYILLVGLGSYVVLNIFLAIAVDSLEAMNETVEEIESG